MVTGLFHIKLNSTEENKNNGFYTLMLSGSSILCLEDEEYIVPEEALEKLNNKEINYEIVTDKKNKEVAKGDIKENATQA